MSSDNEKYMTWGLLLAGGFFLGRMTAAKDGPTVNVSAGGAGPDLGGGPALPPIPMPPLPEPVSTGTPPEHVPQGDGPPGHYASRWETVPFDVSVFPESADPTRISPPLGPSEPAVADDCSIIAIPAGWWDRAGTIAQLVIHSGVNNREDVTDEIFRRLLPTCDGTHTYAAQDLRDELDEQLRELLPDTASAD